MGIITHSVGGCCNMYIFTNNHSQIHAILQTSKSQEIEEVKKMLLLHIENTDNKFSQHDKAINQIINVLNNLIEKPRETKKIGFNTDNK